MSRTALLSFALAASVVATAAPAVAQTASDQRRFSDAQRRFDSEVAAYRAEVDRYVNASRRGGYNQNYDPRLDDPRYSNSGYRDPQDDVYYDPTRDYRDGPNYRERVLSTDERVYAGTDGRYYCRRNDGTTGLIVGAGAGGILGNVIDGGRSRTVGTLLGAVVGGLAGRAVQQNQQTLSCR